MEYSFEKLLQEIPKLPKGKSSSVHFSPTRFIKAEEQAVMLPAKIENIIRFTIEFLSMLGMRPSYCLRMDTANYKIDYKEIQINSGVKDERDIVWMKFTQDGYLGVVATSNDVNFNMPDKKEQYNIKKHGKWAYNTSGIIIHHLNKKWNDTFVLIFPLVNIPQGLERGDIERGIGNYLISKGVPILDFYSHNY